MGTDTAQGKKSFGEAYGAIIVALIGLVSVVLSAILPWWLGSKNNHTSGGPASPAQAQALNAAATLPSITPLPDGDEKPRPNLTFGVWTIQNATDDGGTVWDGSTLKITTQRDTPEGLEVTGFFEWRNGMEIIGREHVTGHLDLASRQLFLEGRYTESPTGQLATGSFSATLSDDGRRLASGTWGNTPGNLPGVPGSWEARR